MINDHDHTSTSRHILIFQLPANFDLDFCMKYLMNWEVKEIYAKKVNDEENVVGDINEVCKK